MRMMSTYYSEGPNSHSI
jgi:hypothetical protein